MASFWVVGSQLVYSKDNGTATKSEASFLLPPHVAGDIGAKKSDELTKKRNILRKFVDEL